MLAILKKLTSCESERQVLSKQLRFSDTQTGSNAVLKKIDYSDKTET
jgi:hypothetical protein